MHEVHGEHMGIAFIHEYDIDTDSRKGWIQLIEPQHLVTQGAGSETWEKEARKRIEECLREIDTEPDDDSEA
ncbi:hypothetical protein [Dyella mobilis]|uniref:Type II toxin-antitoxin system HicB family antitoxin n=1 Tax=Dyella mobilis TaxID=1849582 RepID=A0ABS2KE85_9GAMM|nr:hypothetical protein [Dyella mobilis]MBM7129404.1 hypothetical protein [Dyella mobilis]GLQ98331.1 hypothetical protein GCM10007863_27510 [Dyella mobilis]